MHSKNGKKLSVELSATTWVLIGLVIVMTVIGGFMFFSKKKTDNQPVVTPLKVQACERLVLYLERIRFSVLVKRVFMPGMSRSDLQFAMIQSVQDELEHNLAQRLYLSEETWFMIIVTKDDVLKSINLAFGENPEADAATMAQILASTSNPLIDKTVITIKKEFNTI